MKNQKESQNESTSRKKELGENGTNGLTARGLTELSERDLENVNGGAGVNLEVNFSVSNFLRKISQDFDEEKA